MKFGKLLGELFGEASTRGEAEAGDGDAYDPDHRPVLRYKALKKFIKAHAKHHHAPQDATAGAADTAARGGDRGGDGGRRQGLGEGAEGAAAAPEQLSPDEALFVQTLNEDLSRLNDFFVEREEDSVIKLQDLSDRIKRLQGLAAKARGQQQQQQQEQGEQQGEQQAEEQAEEQADAQQRRRQQQQQQQRPAGTLPPSITHEARGLRAELVDLHGEMVLLQHWSMLNYSGVVKIIKKHDKHSDILMRAPYLESVLQQPFYSHGVMCRLVRTAEEHIDALAASGLLPAGEGSSGGGAAPAGVASAASERGRARVEVFRQTQQALDTWKSMRESAKTPSTVLPAEGSELLRQLQVRERWARLTARPVGEQGEGADPAGAGKRAAAEGEGPGNGGGEPAAKRAHVVGSA